MLIEVWENIGHVLKALIGQGFESKLTSKEKTANRALRKKNFSIILHFFYFKRDNPENSFMFELGMYTSYTILSELLHKFIRLKYLIRFLYVFREESDMDNFEISSGTNFLSAQKDNFASTHF